MIIYRKINPAFFKQIILLITISIQKQQENKQILFNAGKFFFLKKILKYLIILLINLIIFILSIFKGHQADMNLLIKKLNRIKLKNLINLMKKK